MSGEAPRKRLDALLVERGLFATRAQAKTAIEAGGVRVDGAPARKPAQPTPADARLEARAAHPWASRGGVKLAHALDAFAIDPAGMIALDVGASTGGFVDVLLTRGAAKVYAVDVGRDQLVARLRADPRVACLEGVDARTLDETYVPDAVDLITCDASFIGLEKVLGAALRRAAPGAWLVALFKPQFQVGPKAVGKGGIVKDDAATAAAFDVVVGWLDAQGFDVREVVDSPILGGDGNRERLIAARRR